MKTIQVQMLGDFSLRRGENSISDNQNRTRKIWLLLGYLICHRGRTVSQKKLIELLWGDDPASSNPENALRITFHRTRTLLNQLWPTAGRDLINYRENGYSWNEQIPMVVDCEEFEHLASRKCESDEERLALCLEALKLYRGDFLDKQSSETWVIPISTHYHNQYLSLVMEAAQLLEQRSRHEEAAAICRSALTAEPYHEPLCQILMKNLSAAGDRKAAAAVYESLSKRLFDDFGIRPSDETRAVYRSAAFSPEEKILPMDEVLEHLVEPDAAAGAMQCDYDHFKVLCYSESRSMERRGNVSHVVLISLTAEGEKPLSKRSLSRIMEQLGQQIRINLRRGDVFSRCSMTQYILMLPSANYENSCLVCRRVIGAFHRAHPHVSVKLNYMVQPLTPNMATP